MYPAMGSGVSVVGCKMYSRPDGPVNWYDVDSQHSRHWHEEPTGYGQYRKKSYREGCTPHESVNRKGNEGGELAGRVVLVSKANHKTNYAAQTFAPSFDLKPGSKIFAKTFLSVPLGMMPIGENNLNFKKHSSEEGAINYRGFGPVLLAPMVRAIAIFVHVDDIPMSYEVFCSESAELPDNLRTVSSDEDEVPIVNQAIPGSFVTYPMPKAQTQFFFLHFPVLATHSDCTKGSGGPHVITISKAFLRLFSSLSPGSHTVDIFTQTYYDHSEFRYFVRDINLNAQGVWRDGLPNDYLKAPHADPGSLVCPESYLSEGSFQVNIPDNFAVIFDGMMDRKPPTERYEDDDLDTIRREAGLVAMGQFVKDFGVTGLPDITIITSKKKDTVTQKQKKTDYRHSYEYVEYASCWLDPENSSPSGTGRMFLGAMAKGEVVPKEYTQTWMWHAVTRAGVEEETVPLEVLNKYILAKMVERRRSQTTLIERLRPGLRRLSKAMSNG